MPAGSFMPIRLCSFFGVWSLSKICPVCILCASSIQDGYYW